MNEKKKHDPEDRSSSEWLDGLPEVFKGMRIPGPLMGGKTQAQADAEKEWLDKEYEGRFLDSSDRILGNPDGIAPDGVTPDDDGNITVIMHAVKEDGKTPEAPQGVVVHLVNGEERVAEVVWVGTGLTGIEMWEVTARYQFDEIKRITIEFLPDGAEVHIGGTGGPRAEG